MPVCRVILRGLSVCVKNLLERIMDQIICKVDASGNIVGLAEQKIIRSFQNYYENIGGAACLRRASARMSARMSARKVITQRGVPPS